MRMKNVERREKRLDMANPNINFVKFLRGTQEQYDNLVNKDKNTLYFIYDQNSSAEQPTGKLYLDKFLISGATTASFALRDLTDTAITNLTGGEVLQFDNGKWKPVLVSSLLDGQQLNTVVHTNIIKQPNESDIEAIQRVFNNTSASGDIGILSDGTVYLSDGNNSWLELIDGNVRNADISGMTTNISNLQSAVNNVYTKAQTDTKIAEQIAAQNHLSYDKVNAIEDIQIHPDNFNKVFLVPKANGTEDTNNNYDEYMIINGALEHVGDWKADLSNYVQSGDIRLLTDEQRNKLDNLVIDEHGQTVISGTVNANNVEGLDDYIAQHQYIKSVDTTIFNVTNAGKLEFLPNYVTTTTFDNVVGNLANLVNPVTENTTIVTELNQIKESLIWQSI